MNIDLLEKANRAASSLQEHAEIVQWVESKLISGTKQGYDSFVINEWAVGAEDFGVLREMYIRSLKVKAAELKAKFEAL